MSVTELPAGGLGAAVTPEQWATYVLDHLAHANVVLASGATEIRTSAKQGHVPRILTSGTTAWYGNSTRSRKVRRPVMSLILTPKKVATLASFSDEVVADSTPSVLDTSGTAKVRAVALEADRAMLAGTAGDQPTGLLNLAPPLPSHTGAGLRRDRHRERACARGRRHPDRALPQPDRSHLAPTGHGER